MSETRPIAVRDVSRMDTPWWRVVASLILVMAAWIYAIVVAPGGALAWTVGIITVVVGVGCFGASMVRILRENAGHRVPFWGSPPVRPRRLDLLAGLGLPLVVAGGVLIGNVFDYGPWLAAALMVAVGIAAIVSPLVHNRRL